MIIIPLKYLSNFWRTLEKDMDDLIRIVKSLEDSGLLLKVVTKSVQNEVEEQKDGFLCILLGTLGASLLGNL